MESICASAARQSPRLALVGRAGVAAAVLLAACGHDATVMPERRSGDAPAAAPACDDRPTAANGMFETPADAVTLDDAIDCLLELAEAVHDDDALDE